ncbi:MAG: NADH-quinone oxidoreductase subunit H [Planctomycetaceae bacterium]|nr:NADH-quinone oxidoreductase subunit H [Planctomycetaceae bacterium]
MTELLTLLPLPSWIVLTIAGAIQAALLLVVALCSAVIFIWLERKVSARIQDRLGPTRVGGRFGWLQPPADGIKLLLKEDLIPAAADRALYRLAPYISFCATFCVFLALPFAAGWVALQLNVAAFFVLAVAGLEVFGVILGGYSSGSKWSLYGAMREAAQVISYEIPLALCVVVVVLLAGTMDLVEIGRQQEGWLWNWNIFNPFAFVTFWVYCTCALANTNRAPFDLPEAESELVAGFLTEYSGFRWVYFFMGEYAAMFAVSGLGAILFLGGWNGPVPVSQWLGLSVDPHGLGAWIDAAGNWATAHIGIHEHVCFAAWLGNLLGMCNFVIKAVLGATCMIWVRWTMPRLRIDQVMTTCLKYCVPIASAMIAGVLVWSFVFPSGVVAYVTAQLRPAIEHREAAPPKAPAKKTATKSTARTIPRGELGEGGGAGRSLLVYGTEEVER